MCTCLKGSALHQEFGIKKCLHRRIAKWHVQRRCSFEHKLSNTAHLLAELSSDHTGTLKKHAAIPRTLLGHAESASGRLLQ